MEFLGPPEIIRVRSGNALGLIGLPCTGKSLYLAALHDQLMHSPPEWHVEVTDRAFDRLTGDYLAMRRSGVPCKTTYDVLAPCFLMKVVWHGQPVHLVMWDAPGEIYQLMDEGHEPLDPASRLRHGLLHCRTVLVAVDMFNRVLPDSRDTAEHDQWLGKLFRWLFQQRNQIKQVIAMLVGVDAYGATAEVAVPKVVHEFDRAYRSFPGVVMNAGLAFDLVPVSSVGYGNSPYVDDEAHLLCLPGPPQPVNVLEPLRCAIPNYLPWWRRMRLQLAGTIARIRRGSRRAAQASGQDAQEGTATCGSAFISYRRDGGSETARLVARELRSRGWRAFLDVDDLGASHFDDRLLLEIQNAGNFILILTAGSLDQCENPRDWLRREIAHGLGEHRNIVPVMKDGFRFPSEDDLPEDIREVCRHNAVEYTHSYFGAAMEKLVSFLREG